MFAHEKLPGLPRQRLLDAIEPVLRAHGLVGVEIVWRTDGQGRVLYITLESADAAEPGLAPGAEGVTLEVCSRVSRDLSTAFDVHELFDGHYRLEVGSPGLDRRLYTLGDYQRFRGKLAKLKLASPIAGQAVITGKLAGVDADGRVLLEADSDHSNDTEAPDTAAATRAIAFDQIRSGQLVVDWGGMGFSPLQSGQRTARPRQRAGRRSAARGRQ
jgi:ribosome maturation factor RimP